MLNTSLRRFGQVCVLTFACLIVLTQSKDIDLTDDHKIKNNIIQKEKEYLQTNPLSANLLRFLKKYNREKREIPDKNVNIKVQCDSADNSIKELAKAMQQVTSDTGSVHGQEEKINSMIKMPSQIPKSEPVYDNIQAANKAEDNVLFDRVIQDVDKLIKYKNEGKLAGREGALCSLNGYWDSDAGGVQLNISSEGEDCGKRSVTVNVTDRMPPVKDGFLSAADWKLFGEIPFLHSTLIMLRGYHNENRKALTFLGECRICEAAETVTGTWMLNRASKDCKDREATHVILSDIWRKSHIAELHEDHLKELNITKAPT